MLLISSYMLRGQRWQLVALVALFFVAGCTVELYPPAQEVSNLPDGGKVDVLPDTIPRAFAFGPRMYWSQIVGSDSTYSFAVTGANKTGRWLDSIRWVPSGPFVTVNGDTLSTRAYARDNSGVTGDNQVLTYNGSGSLTIEDGNTVDMSDLLDNTDDQTIDTFSLSGTTLSLSLENDGQAAQTVDLSALAVIDSTRLTQDSILVYYQDGGEVGRDTIAGVGGGGADNLGNHIMTQNLQTNGNWISGDGDNEGVYINSSGNVGIGTSAITEKLHIPARIKVNNGILDMVGSDIYLGLNAGNSQLTNFNNFFAGYRAGSTANSFANTMIGGDAGRLNTGNRNTLLGAFAGENATSSESVVIGSTAGRNSAPGLSVVIGSEAGINATGSRNVIIGYRAGSVNTASGNVFLGASAGAANTSGFNNLFVGNQAGKAVTTGFNNTVIGTGNATNLITGSTNTIIGSSNALALTSGQFNTIIGTLSGANFKGSSNLLLGYQALLNDTLSNSSIVIGNGAAANSYNTTNSVFLGNSAGPSTAKSISSKLYISNTAGAPTIYGEFATKNIGIGQETADYVLDMGSRTGAIRLPIGTTAQRPTGANGLLRLSSTSNKLEAYYDAQWNTIASEEIEDDGSASDTTDGSGDITVSHTLGSASITVTATATGTTFYHVQVHSKTSTTFKIRFYNSLGPAATSTAVTADWIAKLQ